MAEAGEGKREAGGQEVAEPRLQVGVPPLPPLGSFRPTNYSLCTVWAQKPQGTKGGRGSQAPPICQPLGLKPRLCHAVLGGSLSPHLLPEP